MRIAIVHDYLTQRGGAERVVLALSRAFPEAPVYTSLYDPGGTFPEFGQTEIRTLPINRLAPLRAHHRTALPLLAPAFSRLRIEADAVICSSSGWAHGAEVHGKKIVYCHTPARWLYQTDRYLRDRSRALRTVVGLLTSRLERWDKHAAATADIYLANSSVVANRIKETYGIDAEVVSPPPAITPRGPTSRLRELAPGFFLCVARLLPYKNVDRVVEAFSSLPAERLVVVGSGPFEAQLRAVAPSNVSFLGQRTDAELRWLYTNCRALIAASHEDFGMTPVEAGTFGKPTVALRWGGFLDTVEEDRTGVFFDEPVGAAVAAAITTCQSTAWDAAAIRERTSRFAEARFAERISTIVDEQLST